MWQSHLKHFLPQCIAFRIPSSDLPLGSTSVWNTDHRTLLPKQFIVTSTNMSLLAGSSLPAHYPSSCRIHSGLEDSCSLLGGLPYLCSTWHWHDFLISMPLCGTLECSFCSRINSTPISMRHKLQLSFPALPFLTSCNIRTWVRFLCRDIVSSCLLQKQKASQASDLSIHRSVLL